MADGPRNMPLCIPMHGKARDPKDAKSEDLFPPGAIAPSDRPVLRWAEAQLCLLCKNSLRGSKYHEGSLFMESTGTSRKRALVYAGIAVLLIAIIAVFAAVYASANKGTAGEKSITVTIVNEGESETRTIKTGAEFLRGALEQEGLIEGRESEYGLYVLTVNGVTADESQQQWWCFTKGGESLNTGVDATPIADGDAFEITLKTGW